MKLHALLIITAAALALSGEPPKPVAAAPVVIDNSAEVASLKAELESLRAELALAKSVPTVSPEPVALVVTQSTASGGGVCANGSCGSVGSRRVFTGERRPLRRLANRPRLFGRR